MSLRGIAIAAYWVIPVSTQEAFASLPNLPLQYTENLSVYENLESVLLL